MQVSKTGIDRRRHIFSVSLVLQALENPALTYCCYQLLQELTKLTTLATDGTKMGQNISVACFFFDRGSETRSLKSLVGKPVVPIASPDAKYCAFLSKDGNEEKTDAREDARKLWNTLLSA